MGKRYTSRFGRMGRIAATLAVVTVTSGCGSVYLHSEDREAKTKEAHEHIVGMDPTAVFEEERKHIELLGEEEVRIALEQLHAAKNGVFAKLLVPDPGAKTAWEHLQDKSIARLVKILWSDEQLTDDTVLARAGKLAGYDLTGNTFRWAKQNREQQYSQLWRRYKSEGGTQGDPCFDLYGLGPKEGTTADQDLKSGFFKAFILTNCDAARKVIREKEPELISKAGLPKLDEAKDWTGEKLPLYKQVSHQVWLQEEAIKARTKLSKEIKGELDCLAHQYQATLIAAEGNRTAKAVRDWAKAVQDYLVFLDGLPGSIATVDVSKPAPSAPKGCDTDKIDSIPTPPTVEGLLVEAGVLSAGSPSAAQGLSDTVKAAVLESLPTLAEIQRRSFLDTQLGTVISRLAELEPGAEASVEDGKLGLAITAIGVIDDLRDLADATANPPRTPSLNAVLVEQTYQRYQLAIAEAERERASRKLKILQARRNALLVEATSLANTLLHTKALLAQSDSACLETALGFAGIMDQCKKEKAIQAEAGKALAFYGKAWANGRIPYVLGDYALVQSDREIQTTLARARVETRHNLITAALDEMRLWGEGGITEEQITGLAQVFGIGVIGVNTGD